MRRPTMVAADAGGPIITQSRAVWRGNYRFDAGPDGRTATIDANGVIAPSPVETLLNAVATCAAVDVLDILEKRRTPVEQLTIEVTGERRREQPRRLVRLDLVFRVDGTGIEAVHAERAIQLAFEKYCSVAASLAPDIQAQTQLVLNGETHPPVAQRIWTPE
jgi:putative redox protein